MKKNTHLPVMNQPLRRGVSMDHTGYLGNSRIVLNHYDVATQADIHHVALSYESEDETMGRYHSRGRRGTALYSKQDIREQYCISDRGLGALETDRQSLFGCLSSHQSSPCSNRTSFLTVCVRQKVPSDENLQDLYKRHPNDYAPYPRRSRYPWGPPPPEIYRYDEDLDSSYFRRKVHVDPSKYTWMPSDDESVRMERPRSVLEPCPTHQMPPPPPPAPRPKHVSFARSHTLASFDDAAVSLSSSSSQINRMTRSQERLLDVRKTPDPVPITRQPEPSENVVLIEKLKRAPMKTQATQTEACLGRKLIPPSQLNLSPRTIHRVKMVSQGAQTNGVLVNGRKLMKSYSEAGTRISSTPYRKEQIDQLNDHEPLQRTQSDEPPRSPFMISTPPVLEAVIPQSDSSSVTKSDDHESEESESKKEIFIDFKPQVSSVKKPLIKTVSDGEILIDQRRSLRSVTVKVPEKPTSLSHENILPEEEPRTFVPYFQNSPIRNEGIFKALGDTVYSSMSESYDGSTFIPQDSIDEEFHENLIYRGMYLNTVESEEFRTADNGISENFSPDDESVVPSLCLLSDRKLSPFASNDSLSNDVTKDHSDGIWNESQATVLQVDSGTDNGTAQSSSEMTTSPGSGTLLTPSSRRKHLLLLQHQQRSSMDTEALEEEMVDQVVSPNSPRITIDKVPKESSTAVKQQYLTPHRTCSPVWRKRTPEPPSESPLPAVVPDVILARTDSGRTNTDISESTTTTDDYITANSGTDSSRKSNSTKGILDKRQPNTHDGSSFESVSSVTRADFLNEDMVVPNFSPPPIPEEAGSLTSTPVPEVGRSSPSASSSSCGSYSVDGSCPDLLQKPVPSPKKKVPSLSEDERSTHYSSSGYYESPLDEDLTWKSSRSEREDKKLRKRPFTLDIGKNREVELFPSSSEKHKTVSRRKNETAKRLSPMKELKVSDKQKRGKTRTRSPLQNYKMKKSSPLLRSPAMSENYSVEQAIENIEKVTSDESSEGAYIEKSLSNQASPRKTKKNRENIRKKSSPRSPTGGRSSRRRSGSIEDKPSSLPGSLPRRRSSTQMRSLEVEENQKYLSSSRLSPYSPGGSPKKKRSPKTSPDAKLKALSAESLRSVSPGSDSVFYSDPSSHAAPAEHQVHCLHCGKEVDIVTTDDPDKSSSSGQHQDIVQPPAGFADSPRLKHSTGRIYKKLDKRFRSEDRSHTERRHYKYKSDVRAKSEERGGKPDEHKVKLRPMARSTGASMEGLRAADSSPSVLPGAPDDEDDLGVYNVPYIEGYWIYIDDTDEMHTWHPSESDETQGRDSISSIESTESEQDFRKRYQAVTHRMVHRKSCLEMYKRQSSKSFAPESTTGEHETLRQRLEELLKLMLMVWCRENQAIRTISSKANESDKTVVVRRESGEFGFRIHGSKPVVVSAIEPDTPAESSGLEVGDIVLSVNGVSVLDKSHSEVVKLAHGGSDILTLEVARTCGVLSPTSAEVHGGTAVCSGYLWKLGGYASGTPSHKWIRRWFALRKDNCLYYYKTDSDKQPVGAMMLINYTITRVDDTEQSVPSRTFRFKLQREGAPTLHLAGDTEQATARWVEVLNRAAEESQMTDSVLEQTRLNLTLSPNAISKPDCFGYLVKLGNQWKSWSRRYCVLKDACLYFYQDINAKNAFGVACLHGYRVQQTVSGSKKHAFEIIPPDPSQKHFYFHTESDMDRKRWLAALEYSIDRWLKVG